jgi:S1-C subfamily serine protease
MKVLLFVLLSVTIYAKSLQNQIVLIVNDTGREDKKNYYCSGVKINPNTILTAEHCFENVKLSTINDQFEGKVYNSDDTDFILYRFPKKDLIAIEIVGAKFQYISKISKKEISSGDEITAHGAIVGINGIEIPTIGRVIKFSKDKIFADNKVTPGKSGGPVYNEQGELIAIVTAISTAGTMISSRTKFGE